MTANMKWKTIALKFTVGFERISIKQSRKRKHEKCIFAKSNLLFIYLNILYIVWQCLIPTPKKSKRTKSLSC